jgi:putative ABC transport system permease protein
MRALDRKLTRDLWYIKGQALAIALVIGCGVAMSVMSLGMLKSLEETRSAYYERYRFADIFANVKRAPDSLGRKVANIVGVAAVETRIVGAAKLDIPDMSEPAMAQLVSIPERRAPLLNALAMRAGRSVAPGHSDEVVASEAFAEAHGFSPGDGLTAVINGVARHLTIVGIALSPEYVYSIGPGALVPDDRRFGVLWMGREAMASVWDMSGAFNDVALKLLPGASRPEVIDRLDDLLEPFGGTGAYDSDEQISNWFLSGEMKELGAMAQIAPPIFLGVAAFLLNIVVSRLIQTEREKIGLLKAFGYSHLAVGWHYAKLVAAIVFAGSAVGLIAGVWLGQGLASLYTDFFRFPFLHYHFTVQTMVIGVLISLAAAALGTWSAIVKVIRLAPAVAMQPPAPPRYAHGWIEGMSLLRRLAQPTRMIIRHISRGPLRAALTTLSISMAVAILISTTFMLDAVDHMLEVQFHLSQRQDVTISFSEAQENGIRHEVERLPGVGRVELFRSVPVRVRHGHRSDRTSITATNGVADLARSLNRKLEPIVAPQHGIMLSTWIANTLDAKLGDTVFVEVMEGRRPHVALPVSALVEEVIGAQAYMDAAALGQLLGEGPTASGAHLAVDGTMLDALYRRIKDMPMVADISIMTAALENVRKTLAENLLIMTAFNIGFAGLIAFGVIYNSARIALSERGRELASLRVLGFRRGEVSYILLGELAVQTLFALPLGCVIGYGLAWAMSLGLQSELYRVPLVVDKDTYGLAVLVVVGASVICGATVARRIATLDLVAVLKTRE